MPSLYVVFERGTGRILGRGTWREVSQARLDAIRAGTAADVRRCDVTDTQRRALYDVARLSYRARILGAK